MRTLFLDLASHQGLLACAEEDIVRSVPFDHRIGDQGLLPVLQELLKKSEWDVKDLTHVACVVGPGGFTSLRVAVALANTLMHQLKIPGAGIHLSDLYRARSNKEDVLWLHSTKKKELFVRGFGTFSSLWPQSIHLPLEDFLAQLPQGTQWMGELIPEHRTLCDQKGVKEAALRALDDALPIFLAAQSFATKLLEPWYGRGG